MKEKENEPLVSGKFSQTSTFQDAESEWQNIASILNSAPGTYPFFCSPGKILDWKQKKNSEQIKHARGTGGGPPLPPQLDITDEFILSTIAPTAITGDTNISETLIDFDSTFNDIMEDRPVAVQSVCYVIENEGNEVVLNDLTYFKEDIALSLTTASKRRTVASQRLHTRAVAATNLAKVTLDVDVDYGKKNSSYLGDE
ncbi:hypothetical protein JTB14_006021 [Gonioctena quinquepunctata]|nr:hypothetical protein JTB14_006021 [Gonioctena quinquepunctata]